MSKTRRKIDAALKVKITLEVRASLSPRATIREVVARARELKESLKNR